MCITERLGLSKHTTHSIYVHALPVSKSTTHKDLDRTQVEAGYRELKEKEEHLLHHVMKTAY